MLQQPQLYDANQIWNRAYYKVSLVISYLLKANDALPIGDSSIWRHTHDLLQSLESKATTFFDKTPRNELDEAALQEFKGFCESTIHSACAEYNRINNLHSLTPDDEKKFRDADTEIPHMWDRPKVLPDSFHQADEQIGCAIMCMIRLDSTKVVDQACSGLQNALQTIHRVTYMGSQDDQRSIEAGVQTACKVLSKYCELNPSDCIVKKHLHALNRLMPVQVGKGIWSSEPSSGSTLVQHSAAALPCQ